MIGAWDLAVAQTAAPLHELVLNRVRPSRAWRDKQGPNSIGGARGTAANRQPPTKNMELMAAIEAPDGDARARPQQAAISVRVVVVRFKKMEGLMLRIWACLWFGERPAIERLRLDSHRSRRNSPPGYFHHASVDERYHSGPPYCREPGHYTGPNTSPVIRRGDCLRSILPFGGRP